MTLGLQGQSGRILLALTLFGWMRIIATMKFLEQPPTPLSEAERGLFATFERLEIETSTVWHEPVYTVAESAPLYELLPGGHCKSLFLTDGRGGFWLAVVPGELRLDMNGLRKRLGTRRLSFGKGGDMERLLGVGPGSATPFALMADGEGQVRALLDEGMLRLSPLYYHPLRNDGTTSIEPADLVRFLEEAGHAPEILDFNAVSA